MRRRTGQRTGRFPMLQSIPSSSMSVCLHFRLTGATATTTSVSWTSVGALSGQVVRISSIDFEVTSAPGNTAVSQFQAQLYDGKEEPVSGSANQIIQRSRVFVVPTTPLRFKLRMPRGTDWSQLLTATVAQECFAMTTIGTMAVEAIVHYAIRGDTLLT